jgi:hypothetical protein
MSKMKLKLVYTKNCWTMETKSQKLLKIINKEKTEKKISNEEKENLMYLKWYGFLSSISTFGEGEYFSDLNIKETKNKIEIKVEFETKNQIEYFLEQF